MKYHYKTKRIKAGTEEEYIQNVKLVKMYDHETAGVIKEGQKDGMHSLINKKYLKKGWKK